MTCGGLNELMGVLLSWGKPNVIEFQNIITCIEVMFQISLHTPWRGFYLNNEILNRHFSKNLTTFKIISVNM